MSKEFDERFKELYNQHCDPGGSISLGKWNAILFQVWKEIERPKIIREAFYGKEEKKILKEKED